MMKRLDKLEDFSEKRHYHTKFGTRFVDINDYIHSMSREVVLYSKAIREDVEQGTKAAVAKATPPKTELDSIYEVYCKHFKELEEGTRADQNLKHLPMPDNKENINHGSPSKAIQKKLDILESSSELRHFASKFGMPFIDDTLVQTTREEVFFTKMISGDVKEMVIAKAQPSELDNKYYRYLQTKFNNDNASEVSSLSIFPDKAKATTDSFSLGSDWSESTLTFTAKREVGPEEDVSFTSLRSEDWAVFKKNTYTSDTTRTLTPEKQGVAHTLECKLINNDKPKKQPLFSGWRRNKNKKECNMKRTT
jgi:hypothetical protein